HWVFDEFPRLFNQWEHGHQGIPFLKNYERLNPLASASIYFKLTADELFQLLVPGYQDPKLSKWANPSDIAHNIYEFVRKKENENKSNTSPCKIIDIQEYKSLLKKSRNHGTKKQPNRMSKLSA
ncbi:MAG TPA: hypothetical protein VNX68_15545, partial [Nitrosopumilaceae archaeon]|nr:hypothetical protein [Nitrosopumilaceae archaeon]